MGGDQLVGGLGVLMLAPALGKHVFLARLQHGKPADLLEITGEIAFGADGRQCGQCGHGSCYPLKAAILSPAAPQEAARRSRPQDRGSIPAPLAGNQSYNDSKLVTRACMSSGRGL